MNIPKPDIAINIGDKITRNQNAFNVGTKNIAAFCLGVSITAYLIYIVNS